MSKINQMNLVREICEVLNQKGYDFVIDDSSCRIDINLEVGRIKKDDFTKGVIAVFWSDTDINKIDYMRAGYDFFDGYEIKNTWLCKSLTPEEAVLAYEEDVERVIKYQEKYKIF